MRSYTRWMVCSCFTTKWHRVYRLFLNISWAEKISKFRLGTWQWKPPGRDCSPTCFFNRPPSFCFSHTSVSSRFAPRCPHLQKRSSISWRFNFWNHCVSTFPTAFYTRLSYTRYEDNTYLFCIHLNDLPCMSQHIHKQHHEFKGPNGFAAEYAHPIEQVRNS